MSISSRWHEGTAPDHRYRKCEAAATRLEVPGTVCGQWVGPVSPGRGIDLAAVDRWVKPLRRWVLYRKEKSLPYFHIEELDRRHLNVKEGRTGLIMGHSRPGHSSSTRERRLAERCIRNDILSSR